MSQWVGALGRIRWGPAKDKSLLGLVLGSHYALGGSLHIVRLEMGKKH